MTGIYDQVAATPEGRRSLARARLRYCVKKLLLRALSNSGQSQSELAVALGCRRSAVNQVIRGPGILRLDTIAEYLDAMGFELKVDAVAAGTARTEIESKRRAAGVDVEGGPAIDEFAIHSEQMSSRVTSIDWNQLLEQGDVKTHHSAQSTTAKEFALSSKVRVAR